MPSPHVVQVKVETSLCMWNFNKVESRSLRHEVFDSLWSGFGLIALLKLAHIVDQPKKKIYSVSQKVAKFGTCRCNSSNYSLPMTGPCVCIRVCMWGF